MPISELIFPDKNFIISQENPEEFVYYIALHKKKTPLLFSFPSKEVQWN